ncbi:hypothetical protein EVAR_52728_1 [Eumeta japonica]|uniref:Uncharacterized protein n=1 Tax=Eumeta variegata TaxID=151549 RepID=A0A4C1Y445_EUMVA|nr:hypothetical protein EVAR_52728_1 [Eumeta japonica]
MVSIIRQMLLRAIQTRYRFDVVSSVSVIEGQMSMQAIKKQLVTTAHGHSQPHRSHQCVAGLFGRDRISDKEGSKLILGGGAGAE